MNERVVTIDESLLNFSAWFTNQTRIKYGCLKINEHWIQVDEVTCTHTCRQFYTILPHGVQWLQVDRIHVTDQTFYCEVNDFNTKPTKQFDALLLFCVLFTCFWTEWFPFKKVNWGFNSFSDGNNIARAPRYSFSTSQQFGMKWIHKDKVAVWNGVFFRHARLVHLILQKIFIFIVSYWWTTGYRHHAVCLFWQALHGIISSNFKCLSISHIVSLFYPIRNCRLYNFMSHCMRLLLKWKQYQLMKQHFHNNISKEDWILFYIV